MRADAILPFGTLSVALALASLGPAACRQAKAPAAEQLPTRAAERSAPRALMLAPDPPQAPVTPSTEQPDSEKVPTAAHPTLGAACDSMAALVARVLQTKVSRRNGAIDYGFAGTARRGCELTTSGSFPPGPPPAPDSTGIVETDVGRLERALDQAGWVSLLHYQADGPDGQDEGWRSRETTCVLRWSWDGGDDGDSTYVPSNDWQLAVDCAPWERADSADG